jgi:hypothetical protein
MTCSFKDKLKKIIQSSYLKCKYTKARPAHRGPGKLTYPLSAFCNVLSAFRPNITLAWELLSAPVMMLACYQQAGRVGTVESSGKYIGISGKWVCWFTLTLPTGLTHAWPRINCLHYTTHLWTSQAAHTSLTHALPKFPTWLIHAWPRQLFQACSVCCTLV